MIHHACQLPLIADRTPTCESQFGFAGRKPGGISMPFFRFHRLLYVQKECGYFELVIAIPTAASLGM
jgi:hypothetical protein